MKLLLLFKILLSMLLVAGFLLFNLKFSGNIFEFVFVFLLSAGSISALGFIPASLSSTSRTGVVIANIMYFPMLLFSGAALPHSMLPDFLQRFSLIFPLTHAIKLMQNVWLGDYFWEYPIQLAVLSAFIVVGLFVSVKFFKW